MKFYSVVLVLTRWFKNNWRTFQNHWRVRSFTKAFSLDKHTIKIGNIQKTTWSKNFNIIAIEKHERNDANLNVPLFFLCTYTIDLQRKTIKFYDNCMNLLFCQTDLFLETFSYKCFKIKCSNVRIAFLCILLIFVGRFAERQLTA